jgi:hypothetical protein
MVCEADPAQQKGQTRVTGRALARLTKWESAGEKGAKRAHAPSHVGMLTRLFVPLLREKPGCLEGGYLVMPQCVSHSFQVRRAQLRSLAPRYQQASPA